MRSRRPIILALPGKNVTPPDGNSMLLLCAFVFGAVVFAAVWSRFFRRGPLEYLLHSATKLSRLVRWGSTHAVTGGRFAGPRPCSAFVFVAPHDGYRHLLRVIKSMSTL